MLCKLTVGTRTTQQIWTALKNVGIPEQPNSETIIEIWNSSTDLLYSSKGVTLRFDVKSGLKNKTVLFRASRLGSQKSDLTCKNRSRNGAGRKSFHDGLQCVDASYHYKGRYQQ